MTVHKSQGSRFRRVIVPVQASRILDRTLIYTAVTRATDQVVLVGAGDVLRRADGSRGRRVLPRTLLCAVLSSRGYLALARLRRPPTSAVFSGMEGSRIVGRAYRDRRNAQLLGTGYTQRRVRLVKSV